MPILRTGWVALVAVVVSAYYAVVVTLSLPAPSVLKCRCGHWARGWAATILRAAGVTVTSTGQDRIDRHGSQIVVSNHQSWFDVLALFAAFPPYLRFVAKDELRSVPVFGNMMQWCGHLMIDRRNRRSAIESLRRAARRLRGETLHVVLFAEGTRSPTGALQPFKKGAFVLAIETRTPVLPVAVAGSRAVMAKHGYSIRPGRIQVRIGEPIEVDGLEMADRNALRDRTRRAVEGLLAGPAPADQVRPAAPDHVSGAAPADRR